MNLACLFGHNWDSCKCVRCGQTRDQYHDWKSDCEICSKCGHTRSAKHDWSNDCERCSGCGQTRTGRHDWSKTPETCSICHAVDYNAFFAAVSKGDIQAVRLFQKVGVNLEARAENGATALVTAAIAGQTEMADYLIKAGAELFEEWPPHKTVFDLLTENGLWRELGAEAVKYLLSLLSHVNDRSRRARVVRALGTTTDAGVVSTLLKLLMDDKEDSDIWKEAAKGLGNLKDPSAFPSLIQFVKTKEWYYAAEAMYALGQFGDDGVEALIEFMNERWPDYEEEKSYIAAEAIYESGNRVAIDAMIEALNCADHHLTREYALKYLEKIGGNEAIQAIRLAAQNNYDIVRDTAREALVRMNDSQASKINPSYKYLSPEEIVRRIQELVDSSDAKKAEEECEIMTLSGCDLSVSISYRSPLKLCVENGYLDVARILLDHGADPNRYYAHDANPFLCAIEQGKLDFIRLFLQNGANPDLPLSLPIPPYQTIRDVACGRYGIDLNDRSLR
jgi:HEAT repeat protein